MTKIKLKTLKAQEAGASAIVKYILQWRERDKNLYHTENKSSVKVKRMKFGPEEQTPR